MTPWSLKGLHTYEAGACSVRNQFFGDVEALGAHRREQKWYSDWSVRGERWSVNHLDSLAFNIGNSAIQERVKRFDVLACGLPRKRLLAQHHSCGETSAESNHEAAGRHPLDGRDG